MPAARIPASLTDLAVPVDQSAACHRDPRTGDLGAIAESCRRVAQQGLNW
ncbi:hypothetical protein AB0B21_16210 [Streptomyces rimosus]|nr:hypothetical protein [Streptomyces rimosus]